jgi:threonine synthase
MDAAGGTLLAVADDEIDSACATLAREAGMVCEFTSAAALAALARLAEAESLEGKTAVLVITGGRAE